MPVQLPLFIPQNPATQLMRQVPFNRSSLLCSWANLLKPWLGIKAHLMQGSQLGFFCLFFCSFSRRACLFSDTPPPEAETASRLSQTEDVGSSATVSWDRGSFPLRGPSPSERGRVMSITPHAALIKGGDVGHQLSLLEQIPEISHHLPQPYASQAQCDAMTLVFKNTHPLVCRWWKNSASPRHAKASL